MKTEWKYLNNSDYHEWIKHIKDDKLKWKLISMYRSGIPTLSTSYNQLRKSYIDI